MIIAKASWMPIRFVMNTHMPGSHFRERGSGALVEELKAWQGVREGAVLLPLASRNLSEPRLKQEP